MVPGDLPGPGHPVTVTRRRLRHAGRMRVARAVAALVLTTALASACADTPAAQAPPAPTATDAGHAADVAYAQSMVPHVAQGTELAEMVPGRTANPALAQLALTMDNADVEESGQLVGQLHLWRAPVPGEISSDDGPGAGMSMMPGMADAATLDRLRGLSGAAFDQAWLTVMIAHHQGGVDVSRDYLARGGTPALAGLAQTQVQVGSAQIDRMRALQAGT
jgi:uncharacterized protein (DUF305 family)